MSISWTHLANRSEREYAIENTLETSFFFTCKSLSSLNLPAYRISDKASSPHTSIPSLFIILLGNFSCKHSFFARIVGKFACYKTILIGFACSAMFRYLCLYYAYLEQRIVALRLRLRLSLSRSLHLHLRLALVCPVF